MVQHKHYLINLVILIAVFVFGFFSLMGVHLFFERVEAKFDATILNEQVRFRIGEKIIGHIDTVESHYYKMVTLGAHMGVERVRKEILQETKAIRDLLHLLDHGGSIELEVGLNLPDVETIKETLTYYRKQGQNTSIEFIDLAPKIDALEKKVDELARFVSQREHNANNQNTEQEIVIFLKQLPTHFIRMKENAGRLLYESRQEMLHVKVQSEREKAFYNFLQYVIALCVTGLILILGTLLARGILRTNKALFESNENAKQLAIKAQTADRAKSQFLANMSHEIRTPLNGIIGFANILTQSAVTPQNREYARIIFENSHALLDIINDILDLSKVEQGNVEVIDAPFEPIVLMERVVELFAIKAKEKALRFYFYASPTIPELLIGDMIRLRQVLSNLLGNAMKFTPNGGKVHFEVRQVEATEENVRLRFSVKDSGIGISPEQKMKIFEPFMQADDGIARRFGGTGLGLSISSEIVQKMGSHIEVESELGKGSTFFFEMNFPIGGCSVPSQDVNQTQRFAILGKPSMFPELLEVIQVHLNKWGKLQAWNPQEEVDALFCYSNTENIEEILKEYKIAFPKSLIILIKDDCSFELPFALEPLVDHFLECPIYGSKIFNAIVSLFKIDAGVSFEQEKCSPSGKKVLVAEDNSTNRQLMAIYLEKLGITCKMAENGQEAVALYMQETFDAILMDINMPIMDGIAATKAILEEEKRSQRVHIPIVALTANTLKGDKERYEKMGMEGHLSKPIDFKELKAFFENLVVNKEEPVLITNNEPMISREMIAHKMSLDNVTVDMILDNFFLTLDEDLTKLETALQLHDQEASAQATHYLKGACANLFLEEAVSLLSRIEDEPMRSLETLQVLRRYFDALR